MHLFVILLTSIFLFNCGSNNFPLPKEIGEAGEKEIVPSKKPIEPPYRPRETTPPPSRQRIPLIKEKCQIGSTPAIKIKKLTYKAGDKSSVSKGDINNASLYKEKQKSESPSENSKTEKIPTLSDAGIQD